MTRTRATGRLAHSAVRGIQRYRRSRYGNLGGCRFEPSCSHYAEQALRARALPVALLLIASRLLRCNPLAVRRAPDPHQRARRRRPRANTLPTAFAVLALSGFVVVVTAAVANAVGVTGGCTATVNGADPSSLTKNNPLVVHKHEAVQFTGTAPSSVAGGQQTSNTHIDVEVIDGVYGVTSSDHPGTGAQWGGTQAIDNYLKYGVGLYHVKGIASGSGGWTCTGDAYVQLVDGSPLSHPIGEAAAAVAGLGALGAAASGFGGSGDATYADDSPEDHPTEDPLKKFDPEYGMTPVEKADRHMTRAVTDSPTAGVSALGCIGLLILTALVANGAQGLLGATAAVPAAPARRRVWVRGHPVLGTISGFFLGIGLTVLLQQYAYWPLTIVTAIIFPIVVAIVCGLHAYLGTPKKLASAPTR